MGVLRKIGLTKYESAVYDSLLKIGRSNADEISIKSSVPKTATYPNLRSLINKGLIQEIKGEISIFEAIPPSVGLKSYIEKKEKEINELKSEAVSFAESIIGKNNPQQKKEVLWLTRGKEASSKFYYHAFEKAKKTFFILGWRFEKVGEKYNLLKHLKRLSTKGIDVRILVTAPLEKINKNLFDDYIDSGIKIKHFGTNNLSIVVIDSNECKITLKDRAIGDKFNISVVDENLSRAMHSYFLDCWERGEEIKK